MKFVVDHDFHIHTKLSVCSADEGQIPASIIQEAKEAGYKQIVLTDHYWDKAVKSNTVDEFYDIQDYDHLCKALPLPKIEGVEFLFGCETEMDRNNTIGIAPEHYGLFDFIVIPINHFHMSGITCLGTEGAEERAQLLCNRFRYVLDQPLPFHKVGIAHLTDSLIMPDGGHLKVLQCISDEAFSSLFRKAADRGIGIELNNVWLDISDEDMEIHLRPYRIAKEEGCKFYLGSDAHSLLKFERMKENFNKITALLDLDDRHKFII